MKNKWWFSARRDGALLTSEQFREEHKIIGKIFSTEGFLYFFFRWYGSIRKRNWLRDVK
jgi:hypothetical protein